MTEMTTFKCSSCDFTSKVKGNVKRHIINLCNGAEIIENIVKVKCDICDKEYTTELLLQQHKKVCVAKKTHIVKDYINADELVEQMNEMKKLLASLALTNERIATENKELVKRVEKIEEELKTTKNRQKKGFEELEEDADECCCYKSYKTVKPQSFEDYLELAFPKEFKEGCMKPKFAEFINKTGEFQSCKLGEDIKVYGDDGKPTKEVLEYGNTIIVYDVVDCNNSARFKVSKSGKHYCDGHFDENTGEPSVN